MNTLLRLFVEFFKTGLFSVGGGLATLPFLYEMSEKTGWFTRWDIADMIAISESTPGAIGINMSTYAGFKTAGVTGGIVASLGLALPSLIIIIIIAKFLNKFDANKYVQRAFYGLRPASAALIAAAGVSVVKIALLDLGAYAASGALGDLFQWKAIALAAVVWVLTNVVKPTKKLHPLVYIAASAVAGIAFSFAGV